MAPVNAPFTYPKSSLSINVETSDPQSTGIYSSAERIFQRPFRLQQVTVREDPGQKVVEVVGHPSYQPAYDREVLRVRESEHRSLATDCSQGETASSSDELRSLPVAAEY